MMYCSMGVQVMPLVAAEQYEVTAAPAVQSLRESGAVTAEGPMEVTLEGDLDELFIIVKAAQAACLAAGARQVCTVLRISNACPTCRV